MNPELNQVLQHWANDILVWIGFGTLVGLLAKGIMPGRDPGGTVATLTMGIGGTMIGCGLVSYFLAGPRVTPISPLGFFVGTAGAFVILGFYRLLSGRILVEGEYGTRPRFRPLRRPKTRRVELVEED